MEPLGMRVVEGVTDKAWGIGLKPAAISLVEPKPSANAMKVLEKRYLGKDAKGRIVENPTQMWMRVAENLAQAERRYGADDERVTVVRNLFFNLMTQHKFLPNSPTIMNAGRELQQLSACFVLPVPDDIPGIFEAIKQQAIIHKTGGGTGFSFTRVRPKNDIVGSTGGVASGPISFMRIFNTATEQIKQGGTRRGANMAILQVDHPDILEFIDMKMDLKEMTNFNVSVALTDAFMEAWKKGDKYALVNPKTKEVQGHLDARDVMDKIAHNAWRSGEPGLFFIDRANATNPVPHISRIESTNPCGEVDLMPYDSCNLGSLALDSHLKEVSPGRFEVDYDALRLTVYRSVRLLDNVIDMNKFPLPQIQQMSEGTRRIGLGIMGFARTLFKLGIPYDSEEGVAFAKEVWGFVEREGVAASEALAEERGAYGFWEGSVHQKAGLAPRRNAYVTTIAPTGTISMLADTSGGCEPEFSLIWHKNVMDGTHLPYVLDYFEQVARREGFEYEGLMDDVLKNNGSCRGLPRVPEKWQRVFATAMDIAPEWHVRMQAAFQEATHSAVSKTINLPQSATEEDVKKAYLLAYTEGCKGITVYRDGARKDQVLNLGKSAKLEGKQNGAHQGNGNGAAPAPSAPLVSYDASKGAPEVEPRSRGLSQVLHGIDVEHVTRLQNDYVEALNTVKRLTRERDEARGEATTRVARGVRVRAADEQEGVRERITTAYGDMYIDVNFPDDSAEPNEVISKLGRAGGYTDSMVEGICRLASTCFQLGGTMEHVVKQLKGIRSPKLTILPGGVRILSVPDAVGHAIERAVARRKKMLACMHGKPEPVVPAKLYAPDAKVEADTDPGEVEAGVVVPAQNVDETAEEEAAMLALVQRGDSPECPECSQPLVLQENCIKCRDCGYSQC